MAANGIRTAGSDGFAAGWHRRRRVAIGASVPGSLLDLVDHDHVVGRVDQAGAGEEEAAVAGVHVAVGPA